MQGDPWNPLSLDLSSKWKKERLKQKIVSCLFCLAVFFLFIFIFSILEPLIWILECAKNTLLHRFPQKIRQNFPLKSVEFLIRPGKCCGTFSTEYGELLQLFQSIFLWNPLPTYSRRYLHKALATSTSHPLPYISVFLHPSNSIYLHVCDRPEER